MNDFLDPRQLDNEPARSRMIDAYVAGIVEHLASEDWGAAQRLVVSLPEIASALSDPELQSSTQSYTAWCTRWVQPLRDNSVYTSWCTMAHQGDVDAGARVPTRSLRSFRLHRLVRAAAAYPITSSAPAQPAAAVIHEMALTLISAVLRWYEQLGRSDPTVQSNLARLGVLR